MRVEGGTQRQGRSRDGWYNPAGVLTARLLKIWVWMPLSLLFSHRNRDTLLSIRIHDGKVLVSVGEIFGDAFHESVEWATEEDVIGGVRHDLYLEID
jgi:hypothetical protein